MSIYRMPIAAGATHTVDFACQDYAGKHLDLTGYAPRMQMRRSAADQSPAFGFTNDRLAIIQCALQCRFVVATSSPLVIHCEAHELAVDEAVQFSTTNTLPNGLTPGTTYYVIATGLTPWAFMVSDTPGGAPVYGTGTPAGVHTVTVVAPGVVRLTLPPSVTTTMSGDYVYDIEIEAPSFEVYRIVEGLAPVSPEVTR